MVVVIWILLAVRNQASTIGIRDKGGRALFSLRAMQQEMTPLLWPLLEELMGRTLRDNGAEGEGCLGCKGGLVSGLAMEFDMGESILVWLEEMRRFVGKMTGNSILVQKRGEETFTRIRVPTVVYKYLNLNWAVRTGHLKRLNSTDLVKMGHCKWSPLGPTG